MASTHGYLAAMQSFDTLAVSVNYYAAEPSGQHLLPEGSLFARSPVPALPLSSDSPVAATLPKLFTTIGRGDTAAANRLVRTVRGYLYDRNYAPWHGLIHYALARAGIWLHHGKPAVDHAGHALAWHRAGLLSLPRPEQEAVLMLCRIALIDTLLVTFRLRAAHAHGLLLEAQPGGLVERERLRTLCILKLFETPIHWQMFDDMYDQALRCQETAFDPLHEVVLAALHAAALVSRQSPEAPAAIARAEDLAIRCGTTHVLKAVQRLRCAMRPTFRSMPCRPGTCDICLGLSRRQAGG